MLSERLKRMQEDRKERVMEARLERVADQNEVLKAENDTLKMELAEDRKNRNRLLDVVEGLEHKHPKKRGRRILKTTVVAGTAYVVGTRAGRERYEQIRAWWNKLRASRPAQQLVEGADRMAQKVSREAGEISEDVGRRMERGA